MLKRMLGGLVPLVYLVTFGCDSFLKEEPFDPIGFGTDDNFTDTEGGLDTGDGYDPNKDTSPDGLEPEDRLVTAVATGNEHTCVLTEASNVRCWGAGGYYNALGYGSRDGVYEAAAAGLVDVGGPVVQLAAGTSHTCALLDTGGVRCWGWSTNGETGHPGYRSVGSDYSMSPADVGEIELGGLATQVVAGADHTCALLETGNVRCWGSGQYGQLGAGNTRTVGDDEPPGSVDPVPVGGTVVQLASGLSHVCALLDTGSVRCWGANQYGQLGYGNTIYVGNNETPESVGDVDVGGLVTQIAAGHFHTCAVLEGGDVKCWGYAIGGRLGLADTYDKGDDETPASQDPIDIGGFVAHINAGGGHTCVILDTGALRCWGSGGANQLGYGNKNDIGDMETPASAGDVDLGGTPLQVSAGNFHTCAVLDTGALRCWGAGNDGQLGFGEHWVGNNPTPTHTPHTLGDVPL